MKKRMAKLVALSMTALMAASLTACGGDSGNASSSETSGEDKSAKKKPVMMEARKLFTGTSVQKARTRMLLQRLLTNSIPRQNQAIPLRLCYTE